MTSPQRTGQHLAATFGLSSMTCLVHMAWTCAIAMLVLGLSPGKAHATAPGANGPIVFSTYGKIYTVQPNGSDLRQVVRADEDQKYDFEPSWSPDGQRIVTSGQMLGAGLYWTSMNLQLFAPDGTGFEQLSMPYEYVYSPAWAPDGAHILFTKGSAIYSTTPDGRSVTLVQNDGGNPAWSPDGSRIAFVRAVNPADDTDLYAMNSDGNDARKLLDLPGREISPSWSPDGSTIVFTYSPREGESPPYSYPNSYIYAVSATGGEPVQLTESGTDADPTWSPDGSMIVFQSDRLSVPPTSAPDLYLMNGDGSDERQLTTIHCLQCDPDWASIPPHPQPPAPPPAGTGAQPTEPQAFALLSITSKHFVKSSRVRIRFWAAAAEKVRFTIRLAKPPARAIRCRKRPDSCRLIRQIELPARKGLNRILLRSLLAQTLRPGQYWLQISSLSGSPHAGLSFRVTPNL